MASDQRNINNQQPMLKAQTNIRQDEEIERYRKLYFWQSLIDEKQAQIARLQADLASTEASYDHVYDEVV